MIVGTKQREALVLLEKAVSSESPAEAVQALEAVRASIYSEGCNTLEINTTELLIRLKRIK